MQRQIEEAPVDRHQQPLATHRRKAGRSDGCGALAGTHREALPHSRSARLDSLLRASDDRFREVRTCRVGELLPRSLKSAYGRETRSRENVVL